MQRRTYVSLPLVVLCLYDERGNRVGWTSQCIASHTFMHPCTKQFLIDLCMLNTLRSPRIQRSIWLSAVSGNRAFIACLVGKLLATPKIYPNPKCSVLKFIGTLVHARCYSKRFLSPFNLYDNLLEWKFHIVQQEKQAPHRLSDLSKVLQGLQVGRLLLPQAGLLPLPRWASSRRWFHFD